MKPHDDSEARRILVVAGGFVLGFFVSLLAVVCVDPNFGGGQSPKYMFAFSVGLVGFSVGRWINSARSRQIASGGDEHSAR